MSKENQDATNDHLIVAEILLEGHVKENKRRSWWGGKMFLHRQAPTVLTICISLIPTLKETEKYENIVVR